MPLANPWERWIASVAKVDQLDRRACRVHMAERFSVKKMTDGYEAAYRRVLEAPFAAAYAALDRAKHPGAIGAWPLDLLRRKGGPPSLPSTPLSQYSSKCSTTLVSVCFSVAAKAGRAA